MRMARRLLLIGGFAGAMLLVVSGFLLDRVTGQDVLLIIPHDSATVELNRSLFLPGDPVAELYGNPLQNTVRVIMPPSARLLRPPEDPSLLLLAVDKEAGENPLQARTVWFFLQFAAPTMLVLGVIGLFLPASARKRQAPVIPH
jgi:hypothetical protein